MITILLAILASVVVSMACIYWQVRQAAQPKRQMSSDRVAGYLATLNDLELRQLADKVQEARRV